MGRPLLAASAALLAGAFFGNLLSFDAALALAAMALAVSLRPLLRAPALGLALGFLRAAHDPAPPPVPPREAVELDARVLSGGVVRTPLGLVALRAQDLHRGDHALLWAKLHVPPPQLNPGGRDRRAQLASRGILLEGSGEVAQVLERGPWLWRWLDGVRERFVQRALLLCRTPDRAALVAALAVGDRSGLSVEAEDELSASGLVHLLASSGLHLAAVVFAVRELARRLWLRSRFAASCRASLVGALCAAPFALCEVLLLGAPWPAVRAGAGALFGLAAAALSRRSDPLTSLLAAAAGCALFDPAATHDLALQLSVCGIAGLVLLSRPLREMLPVPLPAPAAPLWARLCEHLLRLACATTAAALCTAPLLAAAFHRVSLVGVFANALALLPGLAAIPICTLLVPLDFTFLWWLADGLAGFTLSAAQFFASLPFATLTLATPGLLAGSLWYAGVLLLALVPARPLLRLARAATPWALIALLTLGRAAVARAEGKLRITFLAVGQGDSAIVELPGGHALLIDAGGDLHWPGRFDPGKRDVLPALAELGISRLDLVVLTHPHPDHAGGMLSVLDKISIGELWMTEAPDRIAQDVRARARLRGVPVREPHLVELGGVRIESLSSYAPGRSTNDNSIVLRLVHGGTAALLAGDIEALTELELAQTAVLSANVLKAGHHGSRTSTTDSFLRAVAPASVIFSEGAGNSFGFPNPDVVQRVERSGAAVFRTETGAVIAESDGETFTVRGWQP